MSSTDEPADKKDLPADGTHPMFTETQQGDGEVSMDEILASIRRLMADDESSPVPLKKPFVDIDPLSVQGVDETTIVNHLLPPTGQEMLDSKTIPPINQMVNNKYHDASLNQKIEPSPLSAGGDDLLNPGLSKNDGASIFDAVEKALSKKPDMPHHPSAQTGDMPSAPTLSTQALDDLFHRARQRSPQPDMGNRPFGEGAAPYSYGGYAGDWGQRGPQGQSAFGPQQTPPGGRSSAPLDYLIQEALTPLLRDWVGANISPFIEQFIRTNSLHQVAMELLAPHIEKWIQMHVPALAERILAYEFDKLLRRLRE